MRELRLKIAHFPTTYSLRLGTHPASDAGNIDDADICEDSD
jgi:hypothetical protein